MSTILGRLTAGQLAAFQDAFARTCDTTATVERDANLGTPNTDASWQNVAGLVGIKCLRSTPSGGYQQNLAAALVDQSSWVVSLVALDTNGNATDVRRSDRILIDGLTLTVQHLLFPQSLSISQAVMASAPR
jgi:hypothetical protein